MSFPANSGGAAFPGESVEKAGLHSTRRVVHSGMSLRDYAVIQFTAAMIAHPRPYRPRDEDSDLHWHEAIALEAGDLADAMIAARKGGAA